MGYWTDFPFIITVVVIQQLLYSCYTARETFRFCKASNWERMQRIHTKMRVSDEDCAQPVEQSCQRGRAPHSMAWALEPSDVLGMLSGEGLGRMHQARERVRVRIDER